MCVMSSASVFLFFGVFIWSEAAVPVVVAFPFGFFLGGGCQSF